MGRNHEVQVETGGRSAANMSTYIAQINALNASGTIASMTVKFHAENLPQADEIADSIAMHIQGSDHLMVDSVYEAR